jgi:5-methyltetrahydropteroyltriglutamate--homocysteine methyltransferase
VTVSFAMALVPHPGIGKGNTGRENQMALLTTCIGAYPKPDYVKLPDWFGNAAGQDPASHTRQWAAALEALGPEGEAVITRGVGEAVRDQVDAGIDIPTDGEISRENYVHYHCRHIEGIDFSRLTPASARGGAYETSLPTVVAPIKAGDRRFLVHDWRRAQAFTDRPVKITMPGPMTIADTTADELYGDARRLGSDLAAALNEEVLGLAEAGCAYIQIDEPVFARKPGEALAYGFDNLEKAFHGCPGHVTRVVHMCCGYPDHLDQSDYLKADPGAYLQIADAVERSSIDMVSLEDAHRHNDLELFEAFERTTVILGVVAIAESRIESTEEIALRLRQVLEHIDSSRLIAAPDCGLGFLGRQLALTKLNNMCTAAKRI